LRYFHHCSTIDVSLRQINFYSTEGAEAFTTSEIFGNDLFFVAPENSDRIKAAVGQIF
jgi:hypothetical protein